MTSRNMNIEDFTNISSQNHIKTRLKKSKLKINSIIPSKPNFLNSSKISKLLKKLNDVSLNEKNFPKKNKTILNSLETSLSIDKYKNKKINNHSVNNKNKNQFMKNITNLSNMNDLYFTSRCHTNSVDRVNRYINEYTRIKNEKKQKVKFNKNALYIYVKKNSPSNSKIKIHKTNNNLNNKEYKEYKTINNNMTDRSKFKRINYKKDKEKENSFLKQINIDDLKAINEFIHKSSTNQKKNNNKDLIRTKITELSSLKKLMFENNNINDYHYFRKVDKKNQNIINRNTINYFTNKIARHKKTKTEDISNSFQKTYMNFSHNKKNSLFSNNNYNQLHFSKEKNNNKCNTERSKLIDYMNINLQNKLHKKKISSRNFTINNSNNNITDSNSLTYENIKTNYISPKQYEEDNEKEIEKLLQINNTPFIYNNMNIINSPLENISLNINNNDNNNKKLFEKKNKEKIFYKKKLIEKIKKEKEAQSQMSFLKKININVNKNNNNNINKKLNLTSILKKEKPIINKKIQKKLKKVIKIDSCTVPGYIAPGNQKINQDNYFVQKEFLNIKDNFIIGISDGHGSYGHLISKYICDTLPKKIKKLSEENIKEGFILTNKSLIKNSKIDCSLSGASCSIIIITPEKIISSNVGISKGVLAKYDKGQYNAINLIKQHKLYDINEMKRVLNNGGRIKDDKIFIKNSDIPGLKITRSFGDKIAHSIGVSDIPYLKEFYFDGNEKFIILATDGIWKYIDSDESVRIIKDFYEKGMDAVGALNALVREAFKRWKNQENIIDDITAILLFFD